MEYFSILDLAEHPSSAETVPGFYLDLNLNQIIERIEEEWGDSVSEFYYRLPADREEEEYRRGVYGDVKKQEIFDALKSFWQKMKKREEIQSKKEAAEERMQRHIWHIREVYIYCRALQEVLEDLGRTEVQSEGMKRFQRVGGEYLASEEFKQMSSKAESLIRQLNSYRILLTYEQDCFSVAAGSGAADYETFLSRCFPEHEAFLKSPFLDTPGLTELELEVVKIFRRRHGDFFREAALFYKEYEAYAREDMVRLQREVQYYLSFCVFQKKMEERGFEFAVPAVIPGGEMRASRLYDLALACVCVEENRRVISNDMAYRQGESFFILTGPNQGGKTTFARSLGQLVYFTKMGLDVPAYSADVPYYSRILTHFSVEESVESGKGKLMEELDRLLPMMEDSADNAFVIINELFTTAANYDACIMGRKVLEHFIRKGCMGIYVTHLMELLNVHEKTVGLRAVLNEQKVQTFKIERSLKCDEAGASNQVKKYRLTYAQIKERFA